MTRRVAHCLVSGLVVLMLAAAVGSAETPRRGGVLRIAGREPPNLDPHLSVSVFTHAWASMVYSQLVRYAHGPEQENPADFSIVPDLAEKWVQNSPTVFTSFLLEGRALPQQAARQRPRGDRGRREVLHAALHGQIGSSQTFRRREMD
jgi:ABC-type transport system substrate-binding protein